MLRKVFRAGNSIVVSLPREGLDYLALREGSPVSVELDREGKQLDLEQKESNNHEGYAI